MAKRPAQERLEDVVQAADSPASKRPRTEEIIDQHRPNGNDHGRLVNKEIPLNGHSIDVFEEDARRGDDILAAADLENEELEEAASLSTPAPPSPPPQAAPPPPPPPPDALPDDGEGDISALTAPSRQNRPTEGYSDLYLDTINRSVLDFDFEKLCSVTLSNINVYACLVCGKYYQGRGPKSHAYFHALELSHHVYINLSTKKIYILPEGYEVTSSSLDDIRYVVSPHYSPSDIRRLSSKSSLDLTRRAYTPGYMGLNNIKCNDYINVVLQLLTHVPPLRNFLLLQSFPASTPPLLLNLSLLARKLYNPRAFKPHVSPHEILHSVALLSRKRFTLTTQADPVDFLSWFLHNLHSLLRPSATSASSSSSSSSSIINATFRGRLKIESQTITTSSASDRLRFEPSAETTTTISPFLLLTLDLPAAPLFQSETDKNIIPQIPLTSILSKYDGRTAQEHQDSRRRYRLMHPLPPYLIFHIKRFSRNKFVAERNPTIVTFPTRSLDLGPFVEPGPDHPGADAIWYDLVGNVTHEAVKKKGEEEGEAEGRIWRVQLRGGVAAATSKQDDNTMRDSGAGWTQIQDLWVEEVRGEMLCLGESYLQVWERRRMMITKRKAPAAST